MSVASCDTSIFASCPSASPAHFNVSTPSFLRFDPTDFFRRHTYDYSAGRNIGNYGRTHSNCRVFSNFDVIANDGAKPEERVPPDSTSSPNYRSGRDLGEIANHHIVLHDRARIDDRMRPDPGSGLHDCSCHYHCTWSDDGGRRHPRALMNDRRPTLYELRRSSYGGRARFPLTQASEAQNREGASMLGQSVVISQTYKVAPRAGLRTLEWIDEAENSPAALDRPRGLGDYTRVLPASDDYQLLAGHSISPKILRGGRCILHRAMASTILGAAGPVG